MESQLEIGQEVVVINGDSGIVGMSGKLLGFHIACGALYCKIDFGVDVSEYARGEEETTCLYIHFARVRPLGTFQDDIDTLINLALDTNDERWFNELVMKKQMQEAF